VKLFYLLNIEKLLSRNKYTEIYINLIKII